MPERTCHSKHVSLVLWTKLHVVHKVLETDFIQDTVGVDEQDKHVIVAQDVLGVHFVDQLEGLLLAVSLAAVREPSDCDLRASISDIETYGMLLEVWHTKSFQGVDVEFVDLVAIEAEEEMDTSWRIVAVDDRIDGGDQDLWILVVDRKDHNHLGSRLFGEDLLHPFLAAQLGGYVLPDAKDPRNA